MSREPVGVSKGVKTSGGLLDIAGTIRLVFAGRCPGPVEIDVTDLDIGDSVRVAQLRWILPS
jgi:hypothetical protein